MSPRRTAGLSCLLGGAVWGARWVLAPSGSAVDTMRYAGLLLLGVGLLIAGAGLAQRGSWWLRAIAGVGAAGLTWSVVEVVRPAGDAVTFDGITGIVALVVGLLAVVTGRARTPKRAAGAHAR